MKTSGLALLCFTASLCFAADSPPFPCRLADYRVAAPDDLRVRCGRQFKQGLKFTVTIKDKGPKNPAPDRTAVVVVDGAVDPQWATVKIDPPLEAEKTYEMTTFEKYPERIEGAFEFGVETLKFDTKRDSISVAMPVTGSNGRYHGPDGRLGFVLTSKVALDPKSFPNGQVREKPAGNVLATEFEGFEQFYPGDTPSADQIGMAFMWVDPPGPHSLDTQLSITGIKNIFGVPVEVPKDQRLKLAGGPKDKTSSDIYVQFLSQAGVGSTPGWAADIKFAPALANLGDGFFLSPLALADVGWGTVQNNKVPNTIQTGIGVTKFVLTGNEKGTSELDGLQITTRGDFETDRFGAHRNFLFDGNLQFFGKGWVNSVKDQNALACAKLAGDAVRTGGKLPESDTVPQANSGWQIQAFLGLEAGTQISSDTVKSSDSKTSVVVPNYQIARLRPKVAAVYEYKRLSLSADVVPRYLFEAENVTRQKMIPNPSSPTTQESQIYLSKAQGLRIYGEAAAAWQFDNSGHYSLSVTYKVGSVPPNFDYVNTVQSGITIKF